MKFQDLISKSSSELYQLALNIKKEMLNLRIQAKTNQLQNSSRMRICRRDFARIQTRLKQIKLG